MSGAWSRAQALLSQGRADLAESQIREHLTEHPSDAFAHAVLSLCLRDLDDNAGAEAEARLAVGLAPDHPLPHYALAFALAGQNKLKKARESAEQAAQLDPEDADHFALLAQIHLQGSNWEKALDYADAGLALDPSHVGCGNLRAICLVKLGRKEEAQETLRSTLSESPNDPTSHANQGWAMLHRGDPKAALAYFQEALRLDPGHEWAKAGLVEALKARNWIYRAILSYFLWMSRLSSGAQTAVIVGGWFGIRMLRGIARENPEWSPFLMPLIIAYAVFALLTWVGDPLFNLLLRLNPYGRHALTKEETVASNAFGGLVVLALTALGLMFATEIPGMGITALVFGSLTIPVPTVLGQRKSTVFLRNGLATLGLAGLGLFTAVMAVLEISVYQSTLGYYFLGFIGLQWFLVLARDRPSAE